VSRAAITPIHVLFLPSGDGGPSPFSANKAVDVANAVAALTSTACSTPSISRNSSNASSLVLEGKDREKDRERDRHDAIANPGNSSSSVSVSYSNNNEHIPTFGPPLDRTISTASSIDDNSSVCRSEDTVDDEHRHAAAAVHVPFPTMRETRMHGGHTEGHALLSHNVSASAPSLQTPTQPQNVNLSAGSTGRHASAVAVRWFPHAGHDVPAERPDELAAAVITAIEEGFFDTVNANMNVNSHPNTSAAATPAALSQSMYSNDAASS
jgi:hypothetical protein